MTDLDLHLDQETPELEVLPDTHSAAASTAGSLSTGSSISTPAGTFGCAGCASSA
ncbi:thiocillin family RiPP [Streptomyces sp. ISL-10]|uniref:thiocillin family RiPP n=1 Tax=Streptomyces sp. ISL-10 TaxID=2819172 RepID=UPI001BE6D131|nr:thiocillin family RiPP [Streptomyces sp. ISL-10]MBT2365433.1 thiocillin family RiPP [Streptomyces sp. ISL-10]